MDTQLIGMVATGIGIVVTAVYLVLGLLGIKTLRDIRDTLRRQTNGAEQDRRR